MTISRRSLLLGAAAAAGSGGLGTTATRSPASAAGPRRPRKPQESGLATGEPRPLPYERLDGFLGEEQLTWHHESHYQGALRGFRELDDDPTGSHGPRIAKANSVLLHELYFANMAADGGAPGERTTAALSERFGSLDRWIEDFRAAAKSCRGWAVLAYHPVNGRLYNVATDSHDDGPPWMGVPLVVVDVYEHAYYLDFQNRAGDYVDAFTEHLDWGEIEQRLLACGA